MQLRLFLVTAIKLPKLTALSAQLTVCLFPPACRLPTRMCGIIGIFKHDGDVNVELYEGLLMLQHRCAAQAAGQTATAHTTRS
jgi:hypothetical protein